MKSFYVFVFLIFLSNLSFSQNFYICFDNDKNSDFKLSVEYYDGTPTSIKNNTDNSSIKLEVIKGSYKEYEGSSYSETYFEIINGVKNGRFTFTHSGIYDYIEYVDKNGKKSKFTINLEDTVNDESYRQTPCF
jgi:hypothetical protein